MIQLIQYQHQQICWLLNFISRYIPLKQWAFDDSHSPKYQKFKIDQLPIVKPFIKQDWQFLLEYYKWKYAKTLKPVQRRNGKYIPVDTTCPLCGAPHHYIYDNNGGNGQYQCKVCGQTFSTAENVTVPMRFLCPYCNHSLEAKKHRKHFIVHKCVNLNCPYYLHNLSKVPKDERNEKRSISKYKLHYLYRQFTIDFFAMDLNSLPANASSLKFSKHNSHIMSLCLTMHINLGLSLRKTKQALKDLYNIDISHQQIANYCKTASICVKPFVDNYNYEKSNVFTADETYIKVRVVKGYIWFIMDAVSRSILGYQVSDSRSVGPCILAMRQAFKGFKLLPKNFKFIADGYSAYPLAAMEFFNKLGADFKFNITQVIGLTNDDDVSKEYRPYKQMIERLNRTYKASYRPTNGFDNYDGANY